MLTEYSLERMETDDLFWMFNHLDKKDQGFIYDHMDAVIRRLSTANTILRIPANELRSGNAAIDNAVFTPDIILARLIKRYQHEDSLYASYVPSSRYSVYIGSDYFYMLEKFDEFTTNYRNLNIIRSISQMKFKGLRTIIDIISAAGSVVGTHTECAFESIFIGIKETLDMLRAYLDLRSASYETGSGDWTVLTDAMQMLGQTEYHLSKEKDSEDISHLTACIFYICSIYNFAGVLSEEGDPAEVIYNEYMMRHLCSIYGDEDLIHKIFLRCYGWFTNKNMQGMLTETDRECLHLSRSIIGTANTPVAMHKISDPFTMSEKMEYESIKEILMQLENQEESLIIDSICRKTKVRRETIRITPDINEELLTMYLAEFNRDNPIVLPNDSLKKGYYIVRYQGHLYAMFQIEIGGRAIPDNLYAIRKSGHDREEREYTLLQFRKDPNASYIFYY
jgi:hypothetical protein